MEPKRLQAEGSCNFDQFTDIMLRLLNAAWGENWGTFCEAFPNGLEPNNVQLPVITYTLKEMIPGVIGKNGTREIKPRYRDTFFQEVNGSGPKAVEIYGRVFDCKVLFEIWEENNVKATKLATQFMDFMDMYTGYIKSQGVREIIFQKLDNNTEAGQWRDSIVCRRFEYYLKLEHLNEIPTDLIEKVTGMVAAVPNLLDDSIKEGIPLNIGE